MNRSVVFTALLLASPSASAQPSEADYSRSRVADDARDLRRFQRTFGVFNELVQRRDWANAHRALQSFVQLGREEIFERRRELARAGADPRQVPEQVPLNDLMRAASVPLEQFAIRPQLVQHVRARMLEFIQLAGQELQRSRRELRRVQ